jgi:hypothetical protein
MAADAKRFYTDLAPWWHLISPPEEYAEEAAFYMSTMRAAVAGEPRTLLELGSGGGNNASHFGASLALTLVDGSAAMLEQSRRINPDAEHVVGDMRSVRLGEQFDLVFVQDAICYMTTEVDLRAALETAYVHCRLGGAALFAPDYVRENFDASTDCGGSDRDGRAARYLEWVYDPQPNDTLCTVEYAFLLREADGDVHAVQERHIEGLFARATWLRLIGDVGFETEIVPFRHSDIDRELLVFVGRRVR